MGSEQAAQAMWMRWAASWVVVVGRTFLCCVDWMLSGCGWLVVAVMGGARRFCERYV
jgi:roadblock/LC7 domain-containing protein